ncbi:MAG: ribonuclease Y [Spirochaetota bacterium]|nr:MAG: ribonuclease Y [Spirochaetota bacterium]
MYKILLYALPPILGLVIGYFLRLYIAKLKVTSAETRAVNILKEAQKEAEAKKREAILETKDQLYKEKSNFERETRETRGELQRREKRLLQKEENLDKRVEVLDKKEKLLTNRERVVDAKDEELKEAQEEIRKELERISGLTAEEAKSMLIKSMEDEARHDAQALINNIEAEAKVTSEKKARNILSYTIQRLASDITSEITVTSVSLPNDEMKGRIIGREGRNIRALETLTGVDIIIDDTPEAVVISSFDPVRREIARISMERLIADGRIHPARIEEVTAKVTKEVNQMILEEGEKAVFDQAIQGVSPEIIQYIGRLYFRTSYGQNILAHSKEVANVAGMIASEIKADIELSKHGGMLHDIGKAITAEGDGGHALAGGELAKKYGESAAVVNIIESHHNDREPQSVEAVIIQAADAISASRPGARRESMDTYIKRLESLENIAESFEGVEKSFAIQAGREVRVIVNNDKIDDSKAKDVARDIAKRIEEELKYPGRIKVTLVRETRIVEYAR